MGRKILQIINILLILVLTATAAGFFFLGSAHQIGPYSLHLSGDPAPAFVIAKELSTSPQAGDQLLLSQQNHSLLLTVDAISGNKLQYTDALGITQNYTLDSTVHTKQIVFSNEEIGKFLYPIAQSNHAVLYYLLIGCALVFCILILFLLLLWIKPEKEVPSPETDSQKSVPENKDSPKIVIAPRADDATAEDEEEEDFEEEVLGVFEIAEEDAAIPTEHDIPKELFVPIEPLNPNANAVPDDTDIKIFRTARETHNDQTVSKMLEEIEQQFQDGLQ